MGKICSVEGCDKKHNSRGYCSAHVRKWRRYGDPLAGYTITHFHTVEDAFVNRINNADSGCIEWQGATDHTGYGRINVGKTTVAAHRYSWERKNGSIPDGMLVDHRCFNRLCCNVDHLRLATNKQNIEHQQGPSRRSTSGVRGVYWNKASNSWNVRIGHNGHCGYYGSFASKEDAERVAIQKRNELFTHNDLDRQTA